MMSPTLAAAMTTTASISREGMLIARIVTGGAYVALSIPRLVAMEVVEGFLPATRQRPVITVMRVVAVINMAEEPTRTVEPGSSSEKHSADKPVRPVISVRSARVRIVAVVAIIADRSRSHIARANAYADTDLRLRVSQWNHQNRQQRHIFEIPHFCYPLLQIHRLSLEAPSYLNSAARKKLQRSGWLISAILAEINHLRAAGRLTP